MTIQTMRKTITNTFKYTWYTTDSVARAAYAFGTGLLVLLYGFGAYVLEETREKIRKNQEKSRKMPENRLTEPPRL